MKGLVLRLLVGAGVAAFAFAGSSAAAAADPDAGIVGRAMIGPVCPVERPGLTCTRPYQATLILYTAHHHRRIKKLRTDRDGRFKIELPAGRYVISAPHQRYPLASDARVRVRPDRITRVTITFDTGIR